MQDLENAGPGILGLWTKSQGCIVQDLENDGPNHRGWKMQDQIILPLVEYVLIH